MAESDHRSYRDFATGRGPERPRAQAADDPLAELARLISQGVPMNRSGRSRDRTPPAAEERDSYGAQDEVLREPNDDRHPALEESRCEEDLEGQYNRRADERDDGSARSDPTPSSRLSRLGREPDFAVRSATGRAATHELADPISGESDEARDSRYQDDEYENEPHDDDHAHDDEYDEEPNSGRRRGFVLVAAIFGLAVLGSAGVFAYRAMFGGPMLPTLPPIIKAEGGPNKIIPSDANSRANTSRQPDAGNGAGSGERLVSREERPVEMPVTVNTAPRPVSTVPVFPDPRLPGSPGAVVSFPAPPAPATNLASSPQSAITTRGDLPTAIASVPTATSASQGPAAATAQPGPASTPAVPAASAPKKIHTTSIRDRPDAKPTDANGPLSIVSSSAEGPAAAPRPRTAPVVLEGTHVPPNKPPASETASAAPATSGGGYAVQVSSHRSEHEAQSSFRALQAKYPNLVGGRGPIIRRADLGAKGIYYRAMVGPFDSADQATDLCTNLKAAGGSCLVQKN
jgi:SPOR domain